MSLIDFLRDTKTEDKSLILEILYDLSRFESANDLVPSEIQEHFVHWTKHLRHLVTQGIDVYNNLASNENSDAKEMANELINLLNSYK